MKIAPLIKCLLAAFILLPAVPGRAADEAPTLAETITYITDKLKDLPDAAFYTDKMTRGNVWRMKVDWFNAGTLCILANQHYFLEGGITREKLMRYQLPLSALSTDVQVIQPASAPDSTNAPMAYGVVIASAPPAEGASQQGAIFVQDGDASVHTEKKITLWFKSQDTANRMAEAFRHAIELSGGKKELFGN